MFGHPLMLAVAIVPLIALVAGALLLTTDLSTADAVRSGALATVVVWPLSARWILRRVARAGSDANTLWAGIGMVHLDGADPTAASPHRRATRVVIGPDAVHLSGYGRNRSWEGMTFPAAAITSWRLGSTMLNRERVTELLILSDSHEISIALVSGDRGLREALDAIAPDKKIDETT